MVRAMCSMSWRTTGAPVPKLNCPVIPHMLTSLRAALEQEGEAPEHLGLRPPMHGHVVPAQPQLARAEGAIPLSPAVEDIVDDGRQDRIELREATTQER